MKNSGINIGSDASLKGEDSAAMNGRESAVARGEASSAVVETLVNASDSSATKERKKSRKRMKVPSDSDHGKSKHASTAKMLPLLPASSVFRPNVIENSNSSAGLQHGPGSSPEIFLEEYQMPPSSEANDGTNVAENRKVQPLNSRDDHEGNHRIQAERRHTTTTASNGPNEVGHTPESKQPRPPSKNGKRRKHRNQEVTKYDSPTASTRSAVSQKKRPGGKSKKRGKSMNVEKSPLLAEGLSLAPPSTAFAQGTSWQTSSGEQPLGTLEPMVQNPSIRPGAYSVPGYMVDTSTRSSGDLLNDTSATTRSSAATNSDRPTTHQSGVFVPIARTVVNPEIVNAVSDEGVKRQRRRVILLLLLGIVAITIVVGATLGAILGRSSEPPRPTMMPTMIPTMTPVEWVQRGGPVEGKSASDAAGIAIALSSSGNVLAVGAFREDGMNGNNTGSVRVYNWQSSAWVQRGLVIEGEAAEDFSGNAVALSSDGTRVAIAAFQNDGTGDDAGHVRVYTWGIGGMLEWKQLGGDIDGEYAGDRSGGSVAMSSDGSILAIGGPGNGDGGIYSGSVRVYELSDASEWVQLGADIDGEAAWDLSGEAVSLSSSGHVLAIGAYQNDGTNTDDPEYNSGHVRVHDFVANEWKHRGSDIDGESANDWAGTSPSAILSSDGNTVTIGAFQNSGGGVDAGHVRVFDWRREEKEWFQRGFDMDGDAGDHAGSSVALSSDGNVVAVGAQSRRNAGEKSGACRVYIWTGSDWSQRGSTIDGEAAGDSAGVSVSLSSDGTVLAIGAESNDNNGKDSGNVRVFELTTLNGI